MDGLTTLDTIPEAEVDSSHHMAAATGPRQGTGNGTAEEVDFPPRDEDLARFEIGVLATVFSIAVLGNFMVLAAIVRLARRKKMNRMNEMTLHLVGADLVVAVFGIFPQMCWDITEDFRGNDFLCRFVKYTQSVSMFASSYVLLTTAIDRYLAICHPLQFAVFSNYRMHALAGVAWLISFLFSIPQLVLFSARVQFGYYSCWANFGSLLFAQLYVTWFAFAIYFVPAILLIVLYLRVYWVVRSSARSNRKMMEERSSYISSTTIRSPTRSSDENESSGHPVQRREMRNAAKVAKQQARRSQISSAKVKTANYTVTVISSYLFCWGPYFFAMLWRMWDETAPSEAPVMVILQLLAGLNSCTNPLIYLVFNVYPIRHFVCCCCPCCKAKHLCHCRRSEEMRTSYSSCAHGTMRSN